MRSKFGVQKKVWFVDESRTACIRGVISDVDLAGYGEELLKLEDANVSYEYVIKTQKEVFTAIPEQLIGNTKKEALKLYQELWDTVKWRKPEQTKEILKAAQRKTIR